MGEVRPIFRTWRIGTGEADLGDLKGAKEAEWETWVYFALDSGIGSLRMFRMKYRLPG